MPNKDGTLNYAEKKIIRNHRNELENEKYYRVSLKGDLDVGNSHKFVFGAADYYINFWLAFACSVKRKEAVRREESIEHSAGSTASPKP